MLKHESGRGCNAPEVAWARSRFLLLTDGRCLACFRGESEQQGKGVQQALKRPELRFTETMCSTLLIEDPPHLFTRIDHDGTVQRHHARFALTSVVGRLQAAVDFRNRHHRRPFTIAYSPGVRRHSGGDEFGWSVKLEAGARLARVWLPVTIDGKSYSVERVVPASKLPASLRHHLRTGGDTSRVSARSEGGSGEAELQAWLLSQSQVLSEAASTVSKSAGFSTWTPLGPDAGGGGMLSLDLLSLASDTSALPALEAGVVVQVEENHLGTFWLDSERRRVECWVAVDGSWVTVLAEGTREFSCAHWTRGGRGGERGEERMYDVATVDCIRVETPEGDRYDLEPIVHHAKTILVRSLEVDDNKRRCCTEVASPRLDLESSSAARDVGVLKEEARVLGVGIFRAFGAEVVKARFEDNTLLDLCRHQGTCQLLLPNATTVVLPLRPSKWHSSRDICLYARYVRIALEFLEWAGRTPEERVKAHKDAILRAQRIGEEVLKARAHLSQTDPRRYLVLEACEEKEAVCSKRDAQAIIDELSIKNQQQLSSLRTLLRKRP